MSNFMAGIVLAVGLALLGAKISAATVITNPDSKVHGAYMGPTWGQQDPGGPHVGPMNLAIKQVLALYNLPHIL